VIPGCSVCGYAVEWVHSSFHGVWRLYRDRPDILTRGRYVFVPPETPHYPGLHNFWSADWTLDRKDKSPPSPLGEDRALRNSYSKGGIEGPIAPPQLVGSRNCISGGATYPLPVIDRRSVGGYDSRCWSLQGLTPPLYFEGTGGAEGDGQVVDYESWALEGTGGAEVAGEVVDFESWALEGTGGAEVAGEVVDFESWALEGTGGAEGNGSVIFPIPP